MTFIAIVEKCLFYEYNYIFWGPGQRTRTHLFLSPDLQAHSLRRKGSGCSEV